MSEDFGGEHEGGPGESQPTDTTDDAEARANFGSVQGDFIYRHHNEPRVFNSTCREQKQFLFHLNTLSYLHKSGRVARKTY